MSNWKTHTRFPFTRVFILGIILFFFGLASMIIAIIAFVTQSWGHYVGTGMWGGACILASGLTAIFVSRLRSLESVKTFMISSAIGMFASVAMLILSAGGLTLKSGFYNKVDKDEYNARTSNLIHASLLVIAVFCLSGNILAVVICFKNIFCEHIRKSKHRHHHRRVPADESVRRTGSLRGGATAATVRSTSRNPQQIELLVRRNSTERRENRAELEFCSRPRRSASDDFGSSSHPLLVQKNHYCNHKNCNHSLQHSSSLESRGIYRIVGGRRNGGETNQLTDACNENGDRRLLLQHRQSVPCGTHIHQTQIKTARNRRIPDSDSHVRLPTEFDEEELPPYQETAPERSTNFVPRELDSGDESDTENSSSNDGHSYETREPFNREQESIPMVELDSSHGHSRRHTDRLHTSSNTKTTNVSSHPVSCYPLRSGRNKSKSPVDERNNNAPTGWSKSFPSGFVEKRDKNQNDEDPLAVSAEICALTGETVQPAQRESVKLQSQNAAVNIGNFYENGPCYENTRPTSSKKTLNANLNCLSRPSPVNSTPPLTDVHKPPQPSLPPRMAPVKVFTQSPTSTLSSRGFGSPNSAFRPVHHSTPSPDSRLGAAAPAFPVPSSASSHAASRRSPPQGQPHSSSSQTANMRYQAQGARPKSYRNAITHPENKNKASLSWKNIPLPFAHNHSENISNESEKKLPAKTIPFMDNDYDDDSNLTIKKDTQSLRKTIGTNVATHSPQPLSQNNKPEPVFKSSAITTSRPQEPKQKPAAPASSSPHHVMAPSSATTPSRFATLPSRSSQQPTRLREFQLAYRSTDSGGNSDLSRSSHSNASPNFFNNASLQKPSSGASNIYANDTQATSLNKTEPKKTVSAHEHLSSGTSLPTSYARKMLIHTAGAKGPSVGGRSEESAKLHTASSVSGASAAASHPLSLSPYLMKESTINGSQPPHQHSTPQQRHQNNQQIHQPQQPRLGVQLQQQRRQQQLRNETRQQQQPSPQAHQLQQVPHHQPQQQQQQQQRIHQPPQSRQQQLLQHQNQPPPPPPQQQQQQLQQPQPQQRQNQQPPLQQQQQHPHQAQSPTGRPLFSVLL